MGNFISKVLKIELVTLFFITVLAFFAFYYAEMLPDNFLSISSTNSSVNLFTYYMTSVITFVGYYTGPWLFFPFILFAVFYTFQFSRRECAFDMINIFNLMAASLFISNYIFPEVLGKGIFQILRTEFSSLTLFLFGIGFLVAFLAGSFRESFKDSLIRGLQLLKNSPQFMSRIMGRVKPGKMVDGVRRHKEKVDSFVKVKVPSLLKGDAKKNEDEFKAPVQNFEYTPVGMGASPVEEDEIGDVESSAKATEEKAVMVAGTATNEARKEYKKKQAQFNEKKYYDIVTTIANRKNPISNNHPDNGYFEDIISKIEGTLEEFNIEGNIINILKGPVVDTFELELGRGVKVSKVQNSENELSMALLGASIRIVYPMIGRTTVGIEVPRNPRDIIYLDEVLRDKEFQNSRMRLPIAMGKDAYGDTYIKDLAGMPHMLVAGATGAGKSVFINTLLVSLLVQKSPSQMKLILVDPKQLELALYANLPHLVLPVMTSAKEASVALLWAVQEMERRYSILKDFAVRNIEGFNQKLKEAGPELLAKIHHHYEGQSDENYELPYLVIIVDEFADLILTKAGKEIENNICRLAAKARAAGIHLVLATQRPSVDVITGLIKSNFPTRISFRVTSGTDSRTILNENGAEKLLGKGDMIYKHGTTTARVHSSYVDEVEIEALTKKLEEMPAGFNEDALKFLESGGEQEADPYAFGSHIAQVKDNNSKDELYGDAVKLVVEHRAASASMLQRRLSVGYNRAANLIEEMERQGIVGPAEGSKRRKVLITSEDI